MSEKFNAIWRKVKVGISLVISFIPIVLLAFLLVTITLLIGAVINGTIISICWNVAMPTMFGFQEITIFQAFVLAFTLANLRADYFSNAKSVYTKLKEKIFDKSNQEKLAKIVSVILVIVFELISILITVHLVMYSWNNILPQLLNIELIQINSGQAFGFSYLFTLLFGNLKFDNTKPEKDEDNGSKNNTDVGTIDTED